MWYPFKNLVDKRRNKKKGGKSTRPTKSTRSTRGLHREDPEYQLSGIVGSEPLVEESPRVTPEEGELLRSFDEKRYTRSLAGDPDLPETPSKTEPAPEPVRSAQTYTPSPRYEPSSPDPEPSRSSSSSWGDSSSSSSYSGGSSDSGSSDSGSSD